MASVGRLRSVVRGAWRGVAASAGVATIGFSVYFLHRNQWRVDSVGAVRFSRAAVCVAKIAADYKWHLYQMAMTGAGDTAETSPLSAVHTRSAKRLLRLACANGGVWIKVGQHVAALEYIVPSEYTQVLSVLHSRAPESSFDEICSVVEADMGMPISELFVDMDSSPIGAASLAQVYRARLKSDPNVEVAVKVQHPRVKPHSMVDMATMEVLVRIVARIFPEFRLLWLVDHMKKNIPLELDFVHEAANADRIRRMLAHFEWLHVPDIHWELTTERVLVMEYCDGGQVNDLKYLRDHNLSPASVCRKIGQMYSDMIFRLGYVHCDPHPGNVLVCADATHGERIVLLDHGLYTVVDEHTRKNYADLWLAILSADINRIRQSASALGVAHLYGLFACMVAARSWKAVAKGQVHVKSKDPNERAEMQRYVSSLLPQISDVLERVPRPLVLVFKTNDLLRGIESALKVTDQAFSFVEMSRTCLRTVAECSYREATSRWRRVVITLRLYSALFQLWLYEVYSQLSVHYLLGR